MKEKNYIDSLQRVSSFSFNTIDSILDAHFDSFIQTNITVLVERRRK